ncbi:hypothetical protein [Photobacterium kasasachensis]|uniref:hypothetical protein n=1 Tax=Photobacterium kasasachensis TaxID=2910240 RepID=UPI003D0DAE69
MNAALDLTNTEVLETAKSLDEKLEALNTSLNHEAPSVKELGVQKLSLINNNSEITAWSWSKSFDKQKI